MPEDWQSSCNEEKYRQHRDGAGWDNTQLHFKQVHKAGRNCNNEQFAKLKKCEDYDDFSFDPSKHVKKRKGVWWEIY